jgi:zinc-ribbon domain
MFCPRCGHQTISDDLRFCSYCGLKLGVVKASLAEHDDTPVIESSSPRLPRQRDINIGVILMFAGAVLASFVAGAFGLGLGRGAGALIFALEYLAVIILSCPLTKGILKLLSWEGSGTNSSTSRKGMGFGATLMFLSTVVLTFSSFFMYGRMKTQPLFIGLFLSFALLLLVSRYLMRGLQLLVTDESTLTISPTPKAPERPATFAASFDGPSLPAAKGTPIPLFGSPRVTTAEIVAPSSITEHTTNLLE